MNPPAVDNAAHVVQLALTPIFLLSGVAALLNVFSTRLGRISDQVDKLACEPPNGRSNSRGFASVRAISILPSSWPRVPAV